MRRQRQSGTSRRIVRGRVMEQAEGVGEPAEAGSADSARSDPRYSVAFERALDAIVFLDSSGRFIEANASACALFNADPAKVTDYALIDFADSKEAAMRAWDVFIRKGEFVGEFVMRRLDGSPLDVEIAAKAEVMPGVHMAVVRDVTKRVAAENALRESEEQFRRLAENSPAIIYRYRIQPDRKMEYMSPAFEQVTGYTVEEIYSQPDLARSVVHPDDAHLVRQVMTSPETLPQRFEVRWFHRDGHLIWTAQRISLIRDAEGKVVAVEGVAIDVTGIKRNEKIDTLLHEIDRKVLEGVNIDEILGRTCETVASVFGLPLVWIGSKESDGSVVPRAFAGAGADILDDIDVRWDSGPQSEGPAGRAIATGETQVIEISEAAFTPWRERLAQHGYNAVAAVPLSTDAGTVGCFVLDARSRKTFTPDLLNQVEGLATRVMVSIHIAEAQERLRLQVAAMNAAANAMLIADATGTIEWVNEAYLEMSGYSMEETIGQPIRLMSSKARGGADSMIKSVIAGNAWRGELVERRKDGSLYTVIETVTPILNPETGEPQHYVGVFEDVTALREAEGQLLYHTMYDPLTGLANRGLLLDRLTRALTRADVEDRSIAVVVVDIDDFKLINDSLGYEAGDLMLAEVAERLKSAAGPLDTVARVAGDEFAVLIEGVEQEQSLVELAKKITDAFIHPFELGHLPSVNISVSVGISLASATVDPGALVRDAEVALHRAKESGRGGVEYFDEGYRDRSAKRFEITNDLHHAIEKDELVVHYQPVVNLREQKIMGAEALVRWVHPDKGVIPPLDFIPIAEETGLIVQIGRYVLEESLRQLYEWRGQGVVTKGFEIAVNLSAVQLDAPEFPSYVAMLLDSGGFEAGDLSFEITESILLRDMESAIRFLNRIRAIGINCAIDDFGTGYSSFGYLQNLPVGALKIDRMFVDKLDPAGGSSAIVRGIVEMAHALDIETVAEGVETQDQMAMLASLGCDYIQGFHISRPVPPDEFAQLMLTEPGWLMESTA
ncbi:MAG: hypothetical protein DCC49_08315 [Acidobacteria bacterium]|nr:MAG: hypothetical protein DCC49_08315 [Acidobacteriota bacterium]